MPQNTIPNIPLHKQIFALSVGHSIECIDETIHAMALVFSEACIESNVSFEQAFKTLNLESFENYLCQILEQKDCNCFTKK